MSYIETRNMINAFNLDETFDPKKSMKKITKKAKKHEASLTDYNPIGGKFHLSKKSLKKLSKAFPLIQEVVKLAITLSKVDFAVFEVLRTYKTQRSYVKRGVSKTMNSFHLYGLAVDLVAYVDGKLTWDVKYYKAIRKAMKKAMKMLGVSKHIRNGFDMWGWDFAHWQVGNIATHGKDPRKFYKSHKFIGFR